MTPCAPAGVRTTLRLLPPLPAQGGCARAQLHRPHLCTALSRLYPGEESCKTQGLIDHLRFVRAYLATIPASVSGSVHSAFGSSRRAAKPPHPPSCLLHVLVLGLVSAPIRTTWDCSEAEVTLQKYDDAHTGT